MNANINWRVVAAILQAAAVAISECMPNDKKA